MLKYICFLATCFLLLSCEQNNTEVIPLNCTLSSDTLHFHLDMPQYSGKMAGSFHDKKTKQDYVYFGNDFYGIEVFDTKGKLKFKIPVKSSFLDVPPIQSVQFISLDSILIFPDELNKVYLLNQKGEVLKEVKLPKKKFQDYEIDYVPTYGQLFYKDGAFYTNMSAYVDDFDAKNELKERRRAANINIQLPYCQKIGGVFSDSTYWSGVFPFKWSRFIPQNTFYIPFSKFFISGDKLLVTSIHRDSLFVFRLEDYKLLQTQKITSDYNKKIG
ncbi:MAG: hypothetical protein ABI207_08265, partial [Crocinitomicaceae bacterium]